MDLTFTDEQLAFRDELRGWLADNAPGTDPEDDEDKSYQFRRDWQRKLHEGGWAGVHWPTEYGGRGAALTETAVFFEGMGKGGAPPPAHLLGLLLGGPTPLGWGNGGEKGPHPPPDLRPHADLG